MANFKNMEMAASLSKNPHISVQSSFFGLITKVIYTPTGSPVKAVMKEYSTEDGETLKRLLATPEKDLAEFIGKCKDMKSVGMGPVRLEACISEDNRFAALQLFGYSDFEYRPISDIRILTGDDAETVSVILK